MIKLDLNNTANNDDANTHDGFTGFIIADSGKEVNGVAIDLGRDIQSYKRANPVGRDFDDVFRDFIYGVWPSGVTITLWGLGANRDCNITMWAYDNDSTPRRLADWTANGTFLFTTDFNGGLLNWPYDEYDPIARHDGTATTDYLGRIILTSTRHTTPPPASPSGQPFAFVNALQVVPKGTYVPTPYAQHPVPFDGTEDVTVDVILAWKAGGYAEKHDVYFGTDVAKVTDANRSNPQGVLVSQNNSTTTYDPPGFLNLDTTYYWRIDEVNAAPDHTIFKGEVWSFTTLPYTAIENFNSYENDSALLGVWKNGSTSAVVSVETTIVRDGNSMRYRYMNNLPPYYSEAYVDIADLGISPNWPGMGAEALELYFYGEPNNPMGEQMYLKLTDGDSPAKTATVMYDNMNDVRLKQWNKWSIALAGFTDVNLANVARITIGFSDGSAGNAGKVYVEDITLHSEVEMLPEVTGEVAVNIVYQELEGFGAAGGWYETFVLAVPQPDRDKLYDILFDELGLDIYRLRNTYDQGSSGAAYIDNSAQIITAARQRNPSLKIMISSWSPPVYLKSNDNLVGGTLKKDPNGNYMYNAFSQWWADSLDDWDSHGIVADYVNIQNEPDYLATWDSCRFNATESSSIAGYRQAFEAVYQKLVSQMPVLPKLLVPETAGFSGLSTYINQLVDRSHAYGYAHHLYNGGGSYSYPDGYINSMTTLYNNNKSSYGNKPLMMTEFSKGGTGDVTTFAEAMNLAQLMHNALVFESVSAYLYWELFWPEPKGLVSFMGWGYYKINPIYYAFKQYSAFTNPGWHRVEATTSLGSLGNLRISAFKSPDNQQLSIVIINLAYNNMNLTLNLNSFPLDSSEIYRTSETENTAYIGPFYEADSLMLPARSITTIHSPDLSNCANVLATGYGLTSDIYPDCYVNYKDLKIITDYWLNTDCTEQGNCEGADFEPIDGYVDLADFSRFAEQWMWCNDPEDSDCIANWP
jgi:O-glycosyl hydrolase